MNDGKAYHKERVIMFIMQMGDMSFRVECVDGGFVVTNEPPDGVIYTNGPLSVVENAYHEELSHGAYMPGPPMMEFCTARRLGIELPQPQLESKPDRIY